MTDRAVVVVTRVASPWAGIPTEEWVASREHLLDAVAAQPFRHCTQPIWWVWRTCHERADQVREIRDRVYPDAHLAVGPVGTLDSVAPDMTRFTTVRIDSDDAWLPSELDHLHEWMPQQLDRMNLARKGIPVESVMVNYQAGWQLDWQTGQIANHGWPNTIQQGPFLALVHESRKRMLGVGGDHTKVRLQRPTVIHINRRSWVQVAHGANIKNAWRNRTPLDDQRRQSVLDRAHIRWEKP